MSEEYVRSYNLTKQFRGNYYIKLFNGSYHTNLTQSSSLNHGGFLIGSKNPKWRKDIRKGVQAGTTLSAQRTELHYKPHELWEPQIWSGTPRPQDTVEKYSQGDHYSSVPTPTMSAGPLVTEANNQALTAFVSKAENARRVLLSGETIGEWGQLVRMISSPGKSLRRGLDAYVGTLRKRVTRRSVRRLPKYRRSSEQAKIIGDTWLEYNFGFKPLVSEIDEAIDYFNEEDPTARYDLRSIKAAGVAEDAQWILGSKARVQYTPGKPGVKYRKRETAKVIVVYRGHVRMSPSASGYIAEKVGFHPTQWLPTAWELVPYSFLIDYFVNIGDIISAVSFPRSRMAWVLKTVVTIRRGYFCDAEAFWSPPSGVTAGVAWTRQQIPYSLGGAEKRITTVERSPYNGSFIPDLTFSLPGSGTRWLNLAALFTGTKSLQKLLQ